MEDNLDAWAQELRDAGCCLSGFTIKVKALQILKELGQFDGKFYASGGWLRGFLQRKNYNQPRLYGYFWMDFSIVWIFVWAFRRIFCSGVMRSA